ncbi:MAG: cupin domain-containing protein, partial [Pseudomonadota bacterium]
MHQHPEEQWGVCLEGSATRFQGEEAIPVTIGDFWRTPGGVPHTMEAGPDGVTVLDVFAPPRQAYTKPGSGFAGDTP